MGDPRDKHRIRFLDKFSYRDPCTGLTRHGVKGVDIFSLSKDPDSVRVNGSDNHPPSASPVDETNCPAGRERKRPHAEGRG